MGDSSGSYDGDDVITMSVFHGGKLIWIPKNEYIGGKVTVYYFRDREDITLEGLREWVKALGYGGYCTLYYRKPNEELEGGLVLMVTEIDVLDMIGYAKGNDYRIDVYVHHSNEDDLVSFEDLNVFRENNGGERCEENASNEVGNWSDELNDYDVNDSDYSEEDDDMLFSKYVDEGVEWVGRLREELGLAPELLMDKESDSEYDSEDLESMADEDEDDVKRRKKKKAFPMYKQTGDGAWKVGMIFKDHHQFREAIMHHSVSEGRMIKFVKSDRSRVRAVCKPPCPWFIFASLNFQKTMQIKSVGPDHRCAREQTGLPLINSGFLARKYLADFRINPSWPISSFHKTVLKDLQIDFKPHILRKAKRKCMKIINGSLEEQYEKLWDYKSELLKRNPNSTVEIVLEPGAVGVFRRMYVCLGGLKHGFKQGCRKIIGLDGCHLKNAYKGQLLCAIGIDGNNCMFPLAYAVVEAERLDSWRWFVALVAQDFDIGLGDGWAFISDRQKGLLNVVEEMLPMAEHRYCVRHMHNNFKGKFGGGSLKDKLWSCARASNMEAFETAMNRMKEESEGAWKWLTEVPFHHWTRSHFKTETKCDMLLNNMCESFNRTILWAREQGVLVMLEMIREYLMRRLQNKREEMGSWEDKRFTPKLYKLLDKYKRWSGGCYSSYAGYDEFEVTTVNGSKYAVHLGNRTCGCKRWDLSGIPCHHAISCLNRMGYNIEDYVDPVYTTTNYRKAYSGIIFPMNGHNAWKRSGILLKPPTIEKQPGRPKKKRRPEMPDVIEKQTNGVKTLSRKTQSSVRCGRCNQVGHNRRTCPEVNEASADDQPAQNPEMEEDNVNTVDEEEMQGAYNEMILDYPEEGPALTQPSQVEAVETEGPPLQTDATLECSDDTPLEVAASKIRRLRVQKMGLTTTKDSPIMLAAGKIQKLKERLKDQNKKAKNVSCDGGKHDIGNEDVRRQNIKQETKDKIEEGKSRKRKGESDVEFQPVRRSGRLNGTPVLKFQNTENSPVCIPEDTDTITTTKRGQSSKQKEQLNSYTGPMKLGKQTAAPVKQYKTLVGKTMVKSAPFLSHGKTVVTRTALTNALHGTTQQLRNTGKGKSTSKGKEKQN